MPSLRHLPSNQIEEGEIVPTQIIENEKIPTEISNPGWVFDPEEGQRIEGKFIFGDQTEISERELEFTIGEEQLPNVEPTPTEFDESMIVVVIIVIAAIAAALFFLKGYKK